MLLYCVHILYLLRLVSSFRLKLDGNFSLVSKWHYTYTISGLSEESTHPTTKTLRRIRAMATEARRDMLHDEFLADSSLEKRPLKTRQKQIQRNRNAMTPKTTKYERGTTRRTDILRDRGKHKLVNSDSGESPNIMGRPHHPIARAPGAYVYTYVNNTVNANGEKQQRVFIYNQSHYVQYIGNVIPGDYVNLYKLWLQLKTSHPAKEFDDTFKPPYWMEWHKPPWWMDWHSPPPFALQNDTWEIWNQPGLKPPEPTAVSYLRFDLSDWLNNFWSKGQTTPQNALKRKGHGRVKVVNTNPNLWKDVNKHPSALKVIDHLKAPIAADYVYSYVNNSMNDKGLRNQKVVLYNKTHYIVYTGNVVPSDYIGLCKLWADIKDEYIAKEFDDEFKPPWWMEWHRPPWWMEWHTPPPGMLDNNTWEIWNQPGMKPPAARNSFDWSKLFSLWKPEHDEPISSVHRNPAAQKVYNHLKSPVAPDYVYSYVNTTENGQRIILYNKTHYLQYTGKVVPRDYMGLCKLWADLKDQYNPREFDNEFKPPWWMEFHRPPWWMEWHTPPPGLLSNGTWDIWNQPGMKPPLVKLVRQYPGHHAPVQHRKPRKPSAQKVLDHLKSPIAPDYVYSYVNNSVNAQGLRQQTVILYNKSHYLVYTGNVVPKDYNGLCKLWADIKNQYAVKVFDEVFKPPWWMEWHRPPWWMEWHTPPPGLLANDTWEIWNQPGMKPAAARNSFDLTKWLRQLWHEIVDHNSNENSRKQQVRPSTVDSSWFQYGYKTSSRPHGETQPHRYQIGVRRVRDDKKINSFTKHILDRTLKLFDEVKDRSPEYHWRKGVNRIARSYESKFKEYLRSIRDLSIKSKQSSSKVVFDAIDISSGIVKSLVNTMVNDMGTKRTLRNTPTLNIFQKELDKEMKKLLEAACTNLNACKSDSGLIQLLIEVLNLILSSNDEKFREAFVAAIKAGKNTALYARIFDNNRNSKLETKYNLLDRLSIDVQRAMVLLIINIINNRNAPLQTGQVNKMDSGTIVFQDILNVIEEDVSPTAENVEEWDAIRSDSNAWANDEGPSVQPIVFRFVNHIDQCINRLDRQSFEIVMSNVRKLVALFYK